MKRRHACELGAECFEVSGNDSFKMVPAHPAPRYVRLCKYAVLHFRSLHFISVQ